jgi:casein kinase II subunit beta
MTGIRTRTGAQSQTHRQIDLRQGTRPQPTISDELRRWKQTWLRQNPWLCDVTDDFIADRFNLYGLPDVCARFTQCCDVIIGKLGLEATSPIASDLTRQLPVAYGLIHARFVMSPDGIERVTEKYREGVFGTCPRLCCEKERLLPIGLTSEVGQKPVKTFCPCCREIYEPRPKQDTDGAYFGPNMVHLFVDQVRAHERHAAYKPYAHCAFGFRLRPPHRT